jgi:hypothetical protein
MQEIESGTAGAPAIGVWENQGAENDESEIRCTASDSGRRGIIGATLLLPQLESVPPPGTVEPVTPLKSSAAKVGEAETIGEAGTVGVAELGTAVINVTDATEQSEFSHGEDGSTDATNVELIKDTSGGAGISVKLYVPPSLGLRDKIEAGLAGTVVNTVKLFENVAADVAGVADNSGARIDVIA